MTCPFYKQGLCTSPLLGEPRSDVYRPGVCDGDAAKYTRCPYYSTAGKEGLEYFSEKTSTSEKPVPLLHYLRKIPSSSCQFFNVKEYNRNYIASCGVLMRLLTRFEVELCEVHPETCPLRRYASAYVSKQ